LEAGKHVFVEKPLALSEAELESVTKVYTALGGVQSGQMLMVGFNRRFAPLAVRLKEFLAQVKDPLAVHYQVNAGYIPGKHWVHDPQVGGGRITGEVCHFVDFLVFLTGSTPVSVFAQALPNAGRYRDDNVVVTLRFENGSLGTISYMANGDKAFPKEKVTAFGGGAVAELDDFRTLKLVRAGKTSRHPSRLRQDKGHRAELKAFIESIRAGTDAPIPFDELVMTTRATFKIGESIRSGKAVQIID
jgi:predicted dehydrogenase